MAREELEARIDRHDDGVTPQSRSAADTSLGELLKQLTADTGQLISQEVNLAKAEMRQTGATLARDGAKLGIAFGLGLAGVLALGAFLVVALGDLFNNYWLSALLVGAAFLAIGAVLARNAMRDVKRRGLKPDETIETLKEDTAWAKQEAREFKRELTR